MSFHPLNHTVIQSGVAVLRYRFTAINFGAITYRMQADEGLSEGREGGRRQRARETDGRRVS